MRLHVETHNSCAACQHEKVNALNEPCCSCTLRGIFFIQKECSDCVSWENCEKCSTCNSGFSNYEKA